MQYVITSAVTMVRPHEKKMSKLFSCSYDHYDVAKYRRNLNFEKMNTAAYTGKNDGFWLFEEYVRSTSNKILFRQCYAKQMPIQLSFEDW